MTKAVWGICFVLAFAVSASAQTTSYKLRIYLSGATAPMTTTTLQASGFICNQAAPPTGATTTNPTKVVFDDPAVAGRVCIYTDPGTGPLLALPTGFQNYTATLAAMGAGGAESAESNAAPFSRTAPAPANVRLVQ